MTSSGLLFSYFSVIRSLIRRKFSANNAAQTTSWWNHYLEAQWGARDWSDRSDGFDRSGRSDGWARECFLMVVWRKIVGGNFFVADGAAVETNRYLCGVEKWKLYYNNIFITMEKLPLRQ